MARQYQHGAYVPRFTGKADDGRYYYRGQQWLGPTNEIGRRTRPRVRWGHKGRPNDAATDGPFMMASVDRSSHGAFGVYPR